MAPPKDVDGLAALQNALSSVGTLIERFRLALQSPTPSHPEIKDSPNPLALLSDASKILKAKTTKLSLLVLNKPFTPSAIIFILKSLSGSCLPGLMSALELCPATQYTHLLHNFIQSSLSIIMIELLNLLASIPQDEHGIEKVRRDVLVSTGLLWAECDKLVELATTGLVGLAKQKVEAYHDLLKDAIEELDAWDPDEDAIGSDTDSVKSSSQTPATAPAANDDDPSIISPMALLRQRAILHLRVVRVLYPALQKRRIVTLPNIINATASEALPAPSQIEGFDQLILYTQQWTEAADEIAGVLYEGDEVQVERRLRLLRESAEKCVNERRRDWKVEKDEFTGWAEKWLARLKDVGEA